MKAGSYKLLGGSLAVLVLWLLYLGRVDAVPLLLLSGVFVFMVFKFFDAFAGIRDTLKK